jgi:hypothetical protein
MPRTLWLILSMVLISTLPPSAFAQGRCTTKWNQLFQRYETQCDDGSSATEKYNPLFRQWEQTITPGPNPGQGLRPQQRCTTKYNSLFQRWETQCD